MAKIRKNVSPKLSRADLLELKRLKKATDAVYRNFWLGALGIKPPKPPRIEPLLCSLGHAMDRIARILPPPKPPL
jgi:hypothetical protein